MAESQFVEASQVLLDYCKDSLEHALMVLIRGEEWAECVRLVSAAYSGSVCLQANSCCRMHRCIASVARSCSCRMCCPISAKCAHGVTHSCVADIRLDRRSSGIAARSRRGSRSTCRPWRACASCAARSCSTRATSTTVRDSRFPANSAISLCVFPHSGGARGR